MQRPTYTLYKSPVQLDTLAIVQYLYSIGVNAIPSIIIERNHPTWVNVFPSIETSDGTRYYGIEQCVEFYKQFLPLSHIGCNENLLEVAIEFKKNNPKYCIRS